MSNLLKTFVRGLVAVVPLLMTIALLWWMFVSAESLFRSIIQLLIPDNYYIPGLGLVTAVFCTFAVGVFTQSSTFNFIFSRLEILIVKLPLVKTIYNSIKDFVTFFYNKDKKFSKSVVISLPNSDFKLLGLVTTETLDDILSDSTDNMLAVYLPMSYQLGGYTVLLPKEQVQATDTNVEDSLRFIMTAGVSQK